MHDLAKAYDPTAIEARWAEKWVTDKLFEVKTPAPGDTRPVFTLLLPPPNVTGRLHMGHMLNQTEMDIIIRWRRMSGDLALWVPGTDHAGIATQMMVERQLATEGIKRSDMGREQFIERVWKWREHYGGAILEQMKRLGVSVDWSREYFTMDEGLSAAVRGVFVRLYEEGLIYRGNYIVNWCPRCMTAISDLEVVHQETTGKLYEIRYPIVGTTESIVVATTRLETMLGDTAVAVNEKDARYKHLHGKKVLLPLMEREIPMIVDEIANPEFGTGAVKITPAHDPNDFQAGLRHNLPQITVMDETAHMNENAGPYAGLDRYKAREKVVEDLKARGLLVSVKDHALSVGRCARCNTVVEPRLSMQWFVKIKPLADRAIEAVESGAIRFTPENYAKTYFEWMRNIYDWCISRQLWWGHRIPAWHCADCKKFTVAREEPKKCSHCGGAKLIQDTDVLDTWFSSALLPFTAFGWPQKTPDLAVFYPTQLLITGFDILFFWVARMIMMGCHFMYVEPKSGPGAPENEREALEQSVPFKQVYIHALVRDAERQKMSKTKGNVVDPIEVIEKYGTDAVRFTLAAMASPGTDIAFSEERTDGYRAFANKIWNAARFIFMNVDRADAAGVWSSKLFTPLQTSACYNKDFPHLEDLWISSRFDYTCYEVNRSLEQYRFDDAANFIYKFFWGDFCDWYLEIIKLRITAGQQSSKQEKAETREAYNILLSIFEAFLRLLSPFMPFIAEEIWYRLYRDNPPRASIALADYPFASPEYAALGKHTPAMASVQNFIANVKKFTDAQDFVVNARGLRSEVGVEGRQEVSVEVFTEHEYFRDLLKSEFHIIRKLANISDLNFVDASFAGNPQAKVLPGYELRVVYERKIDAAVERQRLRKDLERMEREHGNAQAQLGNERFLGKAPAEVVDGLRKRFGELNVLIEKTKQALEQLGE